MDHSVEYMDFPNHPFAILHASFIFVFICYRYESSIAEYSNGTQFKFLTVTSMYSHLFRRYSYYIGLEIIFLPISIKCAVALNGHLLSIQFDYPTQTVTVLTAF
jgi:hypothetical protein